MVKFKYIALMIQELFKLSLELEYHVILKLLGYNIRKIEGQSNIILSYKLFDKLSNKLSDKLSDKNIR